MELRKDYFLDRWVIIAESRASRPKQFSDGPKKDDSICFFCPGNESMTPPEIGRINMGNSWRMRWFPNKFPAVRNEGNPEIQTHNSYFTFTSSYGFHEVLVETPFHHLQLWDLPQNDLESLFKIYRQRINELSSRSGIKYVAVFKNHGSKAGTSLIHSHTQLVAQNTIPRIIMDKVEKNREKCHYCSIIGIEKNSDRRCFENSSFIAFTPYASRFNYEIWLMPKKHHKSLNDLSNSDLADLAGILKKILDKLKSINMPFNYYLQYPPLNEDLHFHIEVIPRLATWAGYEYSTEIIINSVSPEDAAKFYRGEL